MLPEIFPEIIVPSHLMKRKPPDFDYQKHLEKVRKQKTEHKQPRKSGQKQKSINIDKLVDDISRVYISNQKKAGIELTPQEIEISKQLGPPPKKGLPGRGRGRGGNVGDYHALKQRQNTSYYGDNFSYEDYCSASYYGDYCYYGDEVYRGYAKHAKNSSMPSPRWGYEDHGAHKNSLPPKGRGRGLLDAKAMAAYSLTHKTFKK